MNTTQVQLTPEQIANFEQLIKQHAATQGVAVMRSVPIGTQQRMCFPCFSRFLQQFQA